MSKVIKANHNEYKLIVNPGGSIYLNTGVNTGTVFVTGNMEVAGTVTAIKSTDLEISDNIIVLNKGQTGPGISGAKDFQSGVSVERGSLHSAQLVFNETITHADPTAPSDVSGTWVLKTADQKLSGLSLRTITSDGTSDIIFDLQNSSAVLSVTNTTDYHLRVSNPNDIPNKQFLNTYVMSGDYTPGMADVDKIYKRDATNETRVQSTLTSIDNYINSTVKLKVENTGVTVDNVVLNNNTIQNKTATLTLTATNKHVAIDSVLEFTANSTVVTAVANTAKLYANNSGAGVSGVYVANTETTDELIVTNRALLFSMLF